MRMIVLAPLLAAIPGVALAEPLTFDAALRERWRNRHGKVSGPRTSSGRAGQLR